MDCRFVTPEDCVQNNASKVTNVLYDDATFLTNKPTRFVFWSSSKSLISYASPNQAVTIFDKVGLPAVLDHLCSTSAKSQSLILCLIGILLECIRIFFVFFVPHCNEFSYGNYNPLK